MNPALKKIIILFLVLSAAFLLARPLLRNEYGEVLARTRILMGTVVEIKASVPAGVDAAKVSACIDRAFGEIERVERLFGVFKDDSEISRINRVKKNTPLKIDGEVFALIESSVEYSRKTEGAFDITVKPLVDLWKKSASEKKLPTGDEIKDAMGRTGYEYMELDSSNKTITFKKDGMAIDMGGVAKGYATSKAIEVLKKSGIRDAIVNSGGDMYCLGQRSKKDLWRVGIQHPRGKGKVFFKMRLKDKAIDTSGDYERYFMLNGKRFSHIIDPHTGYPIGDNVVSTTIIADDSTTADMLATAMCVMGKKGLSLVESVKGAYAILIFKEGDALKTVMSKGLKEHYDIAKE